MKNKIITVLLAITLFPVGVSAEESYFQSELGEVEVLLAKCDASSIDTPYEDLGYQVLKKFSGYIVEDEAAGVDEAQLTYNKAYMEKLYAEITENLNAYLAGEKPLAVTPYDMSEFNNFKSDGRSVYSIGYGHGRLVRADVDELKGFGATNIQVETGPTFILTELPSFSKTLSADTVSYTVENDTTHGNYLSVKNTAESGYFTLKQSIRVQPNTTYTYGFDSKAAINDAKLTLSVSSDKNTLEGTSAVPYSWKTHAFTYTTGSDETQLTFSLKAEKKIVLMYLDNLYFNDADGNNLLYNGGFEDSYDRKEIANLKYDLERAYENNITVCLLLSPHYFPTDLDMEYVTKGNGFIQYNINLPEAKAIIEEYLNALLPEIKDCKAISSICLTNEPVFITENWYDYYAPKFCEWLELEYTDIEALNAAYNAEYGDFDEVVMPSSFSATPLHYDWIRFNDEVFTEWHEWMAGIVKTHLPEMPLHAKTMKTISITNKHGTMRHGSKPELFDSFSDWTGNDAGAYTSVDGVHQDYTTDDFLLKMLWYDFLSSITEKPLYNSEDHIVQNKHTTFDEKYAKHSRADLWQGMMHHNNMSSIWHWSRSYDSTSDAYNSVLHRPDCIYEIGRTALDLNRLSGEVDRIADKQPKTAIFYSQASRNYTSVHCTSLLEIYKTLVTLGQSVGFVMETDTSKLSEYDVLVVGGAINTTAEAADAIKSFIAGGGTVVSLGDNNLTEDEYNKAASYNVTGMTAATSENLRSVLTDVLEEKNLMRVKLIDNTTGEIAENIDWAFDIDGDDVVVNLLSLEGTQDISVYLDGAELETMVDAIENEVFTGTAEELVPMLLKMPTEKISEKVKILSVDGKTVTWTSNDAAYASANIYRISNNKTELIENTTELSYTASDSDSMLIIKACDYQGNESEGVAVGTNSEQVLGAYISDGKAYVRNTTDKVQAGVLSVNLNDAEGNTIKRSRMTFVLRPNQLTSMNVSFKAKSGEQITVSVSNSLND